MKQRVYEILYRELVENYANSKGRTNTADFWLTISAISFIYGLIRFFTTKIRTTYYREDNYMTKPLS